MNDLIREIPLENGLTVRFTDSSRRYFGDYHQVRVTISCEIPVSADLFDSSAEFEAALKVLGPVARYQKQIEHQGVAGEDTDASVQRTVQHFIDHSLGYFETGSFPRRFVHSELNRLKTRSRSFIPPFSHG